MTREELEVKMRNRIYASEDYKNEEMILVMEDIDLYTTDLREENEELTNAMVTEFREMSKLCKRIEKLEKENGLLRDNLTDLYYEENKQ